MVFIAVFQLDATLDGLSSVAVLWRFYGSATDLYSEAKERKYVFLPSFRGIPIKGV